MHRKRAVSVLKAVCNAFIWICVGTAALWTIGAIYYLTFLWWPIRGLLAAGFVGWVAWSLGNRQRRTHIRPWMAGSAIAVFCLSLLIRPSNDRPWVDQQQVLPITRIDSDNVRVKNFRHCRYQTATDYEVQFEDLQFDLATLDSAWLVVQYFSAIDGMAHTLLSFGYRDDDGSPQYFSVSAEIRREIDESFSPIRGLYRQYEMMLVVGDERDLIGSRTILRPQDRVYLYRINASPDEVQQLFLAFADQMQYLETHPQFYNTLTNNCTNSIVRRTYELTPRPINWLNPRIAMPGHSPSFAFDRGLIGDKAEGQTLEQLDAQARIDEIARRIGFVDDFSLLLRGEKPTPAAAR